MDTKKVCKSFAGSAKYVDQGGGKRRGSFSVFFSTHHIDTEQIIKLKDPTLPDGVRTLDLFYCAWNSDLFMERAEKDEMWSLLSPNIAPGLHTLWGTHFRALYELYEQKKLYHRQIRARELYKKIMENIMGFSSCFLMFKDACNRYCNESEDIPKEYGTNNHIDYWLEKEREHEKLCKEAKMKGENVFSPDSEELLPGEYEFDEIPYSKSYINDKSFYIDRIITQKDKEFLKNRIRELESEKESENIRIINGKPIHLRQGGYCNIKLSNLCTEILCKVDNSSTDKAEIGVCNICSVNIAEHVKDGRLDYEELYKTAHFAVKYMNKSIDRTKHPLKSIMNYSDKRRPLGIGIVGFATACTKLGLSIYEDVDEVNVLNYKIWETMYYATMSSSMELAKKNNRFYKSFNSSPLSKGLFIFDLFGSKFDQYKLKIEGIIKQKRDKLSKFIPKMEYNFEKLRSDIMEYGVFNSQTLSSPPNASSASLVGVSENTEPYSSNAVIRQVLSGSYVVISPLLIKMLREQNLWTDDIYHKIIHNKGHIKNITEIPYEIRRLFPTVWENTHNLKRLCDLYIGRQWFISNAQSFNLYGYHDDKSLIKAIQYMWQNGAKNGVYYYTTKRAESTTQFSFAAQKLSSNDSKNEITTSKFSKTGNTKIKTVCSDEVCLSCS
jgi:ribonucleotide reductase alpha subunit